MIVKGNTWNSSTSVTYANHVSSFPELILTWYATLNRRLQSFSFLGDALSLTKLAIQSDHFTVTIYMESVCSFIQKRSFTGSTSVKHHQSDNHWQSRQTSTSPSEKSHMLSSPINLRNSRHSLASWTFEHKRVCCFLCPSLARCQASPPPEDRSKRRCPRTGKGHQSGCLVVFPEACWDKGHTFRILGWVESLRAPAKASGTGANRSQDPNHTPAPLPWFPSRNTSARPPQSLITYHILTLGNSGEGGMGGRGMEV